jgi:hypothetical protein
MTDTKDTLTKFEPGKVVATPGAMELLERKNEPGLWYLSRHLRGDWGTVPEEDKKSNDEALERGNRLLSAYDVQGEKLWIITEADRSVTTLLLPEEY